MYPIIIPIPGRTTKGNYALKPVTCCYSLCSTRMAGSRKGKIKGELREEGGIVV